MLCTRCGTDIGETSGLCASCAAAGESTGRGGAIGSIRPVQRFVHLKPGDPDPRVTAPRSPSSGIAESAPQRVSEPFAASTAKPLPVPPPRNNRAQVGNFVIAAGLLLLLVAAALSFRAPSAPVDDRPVPFTATSITALEPPPVQSGPETTVPPIGLLSHDGITSYFDLASAQFDSAKGIVEIAFRYIEEPAGRPGVAVRKEALAKVDPQLVLTLRFKKGTTKFDSDALEGYALTFMLHEQSLRIAKTYSKRLASFGEVSQFSGDLKPGGTIRGALRDRRSMEQSGGAMTVEWSLRFDSTLAAATKAAP